MTWKLHLVAAGATIALAGCNSNTAPGNDREEQLEHAPKPAPIVSAAEALYGIAPEVVQPQTMETAEIARLGGFEGNCVFRLTTVGFPSFIYDRAAQQGVLKINAKLVPLEGDGEGLFVSHGLHVVIRPVDEEFGGDGQREAEMILFLPGAENELGYRGYEECYEA